MSARTEPSPTEPAKPTAWSSVKPAVFVPASLIIVALVGFAVVYATTAADAFGRLNTVITDWVGWWYILVATGFVICSWPPRRASAPATTGRTCSSPTGRSG